MKQEHQHDFDQVIGHLRAKGVRITETRKAVIDYIMTTYFDFMGHQHLNVICEKCGRIADMELELPDVKHEAEVQTGYHITQSQTTVYGLCPQCQQEAV